MVIGEMCNKYYKLVVIVFILCYNGVFCILFILYCKCIIKCYKLNGKGILNWGVVLKCFLYIKNVNIL